MTGDGELRGLFYRRLGRRRGKTVSAPRAGQVAEKGPAAQGLVKPGKGAEYSRYAHRLGLDENSTFREEAVNRNRRSIAAGRSEIVDWLEEPNRVESTSKLGAGEKGGHNFPLGIAGKIVSEGFVDGPRAERASLNRRRIGSLLIELSARALPIKQTTSARLTGLQLYYLRFAAVRRFHFGAFTWRQQFCIFRKRPSKNVCPFEFIIFLN